MPFDSDQLALRNVVSGPARICSQWCLARASLSSKPARAPSEGESSRSISAAIMTLQGVYWAREQCKEKNTTRSICDKEVKGGKI